MSPTRRREAVAKAMASFKVPERRACRALGVPRSSQRYIGTEREREEELLLRIRALARENPRYGYRRIKALLVREGRPIKLAEKGKVAMASRTSRAARTLSWAFRLGRPKKKPRTS